MLRASFYTNSEHRVTEAHLGSFQKVLESMSYPQTNFHLMVVVIWMRNVPPRLRCLKTWSQVGGAFSRSLGSAALLEEVCFWGAGGTGGVGGRLWACVSSSYFQFIICCVCGQDVLSQGLAPPTLPATCCHASPLWSALVSLQI